MSHLYRDRIARDAGLPTNNEQGVPVVRTLEHMGQRLDLDAGVELIAVTDICPSRKTETLLNRVKGVHFFVEDDRFNGRLLDRPEDFAARLEPYAFTLTPDCSQFMDMKPYQHLAAVAAGRRCGAIWQECGLTVIPTASWGGPETYKISFLGLERGSIVAVGTVGCLRVRHAFLQGYRALVGTVRPSAVICYGRRFPEMDAMGPKVYEVNYLESRRIDRNGR